MNCFNHENISAVALCASCMRGLCKKCATEVEGRISCKKTICQERTVHLNMVFNFSAESLQNQLLEEAKFSETEEKIWNCPKCQEEIEAPFQECWKCGYLKP